MCKIQLINWIQFGDPSIKLIFRHILSWLCLRDLQLFSKFLSICHYESNMHFFAICSPSHVNNPIRTARTSATVARLGIYPPVPKRSLQRDLLNVLHVETEPLVSKIWSVNEDTILDMGHALTVLIRNKLAGSFQNDASYYGVNLHGRIIWGVRRRRTTVTHD